MHTEKKMWIGNHLTLFALLLDREPEIFEQAFYDPHDYLKELIGGYKYLIVGRKGTGKSAYSSKLQKISGSLSSSFCASAYPNL